MSPYELLQCCVSLCKEYHIQMRNWYSYKSRHSVHVFRPRYDL